MRPDEILRLDRRQCIALSQGRKPAPPRQSEQENEPNPSQGVEYQLTDHGQGLGMAELGPDGVVGGDIEDEEGPPGR